MAEVAASIDRPPGPQGAGSCGREHTTNSKTMPGGIFWYVGAPG